MQKKTLFLWMIGLLLLSACAETSQTGKAEEKKTIGLLVTDSGLGDNSFSDSALQGLERARDELGVFFNYKEPLTGNYEGYLEKLIEEGHDLVVGLGFESQEAVEKMAKKYPDQKFLLIDAVSEQPNVTSLTFKEDEGSYLIGLIAGMRTESNHVGFIGGMDIPVVKNFEKGFKEGVQEVNPDATISVDYIGNFDNDNKAAELAQKQIKNGADYLFPVAGYAGVGALKEAQKQKVYSFGVDSDQYFLAEDSVVTSMMKRIDVALFDIAKQLKEDSFEQGEHLQLGLKEEAVGLAPIRVIRLSLSEQDTLEEAMNKGGDE
ncbi:MULTISPECIES: BMP family lipoprotein [Pontibacillus]|uniref:BMP family ABC transporter substrate-binding protein n=1 Tax=Pontibacillus chungwhensis TaxID=265426 RepID=A0ABY8UYK0_9BACI|nr:MULTISPECIES: BMP family ABC transporter substrate-binding protein [Pontibacillus]MCD5325815.1 BMP family ABC transporter substrate-binding protein [Pontibacillus sp. HN14]WIF98348.1 BMP family ABC transporter substrate-binding protein [Pontibacillus chungwhensis]